jgi:hypothetical protein
VLRLGAGGRDARLDGLLKPDEIVAQPGCGRVATLRILVEAGAHDASELVREIPSDLRDLRGGFGQDCGDRGHHTRTSKRRTSRGELVENDAQGKHIGSGIDAPALGLLGRHVGRSAHDRAGLRHCLREHGLVVLVRRRFDQLGEPEIEDLQPSLRVQHDVGGFEVTVNDVFLVCCTDRIGERDRELEERVRGKPLAADVGRESLPVHQLHGQETNALDFFHGVNRDDVWVPKSGNGLGFLVESLSALGIRGSIPRQHLESHFPVELCVQRPVHRTHAALAEQVCDLVMGEGLADQVAPEGLGRAELRRNRRSDQRGTAEPPQIA